MARQLSDVIDLSRFRTALARYLDHTYGDLKREYSNEEFYWFGLYTANDAIGHLADSAAGRSAVARLVETLVAEKPWSEWSADKTIHHLFQTPTIPLMRTVTSSSASPNRVSTWLCPILSAENEFD